VVLDQKRTSCLFCGVRIPAVGDLPAEQTSPIPQLWFTCYLGARGATHVCTHGYVNTAAEVTVGELLSPAQATADELATYT